MNFELSHAIDSVKDGTKEVAEIAHEKTSEFHENYVSKVVPDCGKYGDVAKFAAELVPGVAEYNAIREGDWQAFAISAGIDVAAVAVGAFTAGAGYAALKGGAKATAKVAAKEVAEAGVKKVAKEVVEAGAEKAAKEVVEAGAEKAAKEIAEAGAKKAAKEVAEAGAKKAAKEAVEAGAEKAAKEVVEAGAEKAAKEVAEAGAEKAAKEAVEAGAEKAAKEAVEAGAEKATKEAVEAGAEKVTKEAVEAGAEKVTKEAVEAGAEKVTKEAVEAGAEKTAKETTEKVSLGIGEKIDKTRFSEYIDELEKITGREIPAQQKELIEKALKEGDFSKLSKEATDAARNQFRNIKSSLIKEWEKNTGTTWPRYVEDVVNDAGIVIRHAGQYFDAHHIIELSTEGPNVWWNLHPASFPVEHQQLIHGASSLATTIFGS